MAVSKEKIIEIVDRKHAEAKAEIEALEDEATGNEELEAVKAELEATKVSLQEKSLELGAAKALLADADIDAKALVEKVKALEEKLPG